MLILRDIKVGWSDDSRDHLVSCDVEKCALDLAQPSGCKRYQPRNR